MINNMTEEMEHEV